MKSTQLPVVYVSVGSNIDPRLHIKRALQQLRKDFLRVQVSSVYESRSVGFKGDNFLNLIVSFESSLTVGELNQYLHNLEDVEGRERLNGKAWDSRTLDLDIVLFGKKLGYFDGVELPRGEILEHAHVLLPLAEIASHVIHEPTQKSYEQLCADLSKKLEFTQQQIWKVKF